MHSNSTKEMVDLAFGAPSDLQVSARCEQEPRRVMRKQKPQRIMSHAAATHEPQHMMIMFSLFHFRSTTKMHAKWLRATLAHWPMVFAWSHEWPINIPCYIPFIYQELRYARTLTILRFLSQTAGSKSPNIVMVKTMKTAGKAKAKAKVKKDQGQKAKSKRGQADSLTGNGWAAWMTHVSRVGPSWLFVLFALCHLLCCRVSEILKLQLQDMDFENKRVKIKPLKKRGEIMKPISATLQKFLDKWRQDGGQSFTYTRKWGKQGLRTYRDTWSFPTEPEQYFFPPKRSDNKMGRMSKDPSLGSWRMH